MILIQILRFSASIDAGMQRYHFTGAPLVDPCLTAASYQLGEARSLEAPGHFV